MSEKLNKNFGAYVSDIDFRTVTYEELVSIKKLLSLYGLLVFKKQKLNDEDLVALGRSVGNGKLEQPARNASLSLERRYVAWLTNLHDGQKKTLGFSDNKTDYWHSDQEFRVAPASVSILYCEQTHCTGGETSFASTNIKTADFDSDTIDFLRTCWSTRRPALSHDNAPDIKVAHPVILRHGNEDFFYISENTIDIIHEQTPLAESDELKEKILGAILAADNIYSHVWSEGDLLLYDNSQLVHRREAFCGPRFIKALKIHPDPQYNLLIPGKEVINE